MEVNSQLTTDKARRDYQLVCRARENGDQRAYADLMRMYKEPIYLMLLKMTNNPTGSGMGTAGLVGQINAYQDMAASGVSPTMILIQIALMHFILPGLIAWIVAKIMRSKGIIKDGDMKLSLK